MDDRQLIISVMLDHGLVNPYIPSLMEHRLYKVKEPLYGKQYYTEVGSAPVGKTWLSDEKAAARIADWTKINAELSH